MNNIDFRQEIDTKRPRYLVQYSQLVEAISNKGTTKGGDYIQFGAYYQTYMYAFMIGYHLGVCNPLTGTGKDFAPISHWKPSELTNYILMLVFSEPEEKLGFKWSQLDTMDDEQIRLSISTVTRKIEGYANTGFDFIQKKYDTKKEEFKDPFVFINMLREVSQK